MNRDIFLVNKPIFSDKRGHFSKTFNEQLKSQSGDSIHLSEVFYSVSYKNVLRGMHFQRRPYDHYKLVTVIRGSVLDVVVDINPDSSSYGLYKEFHIDEKSDFSLLIPPGYAHGFLSLSEDSTLLYHTNSSYEPKSDTGICWSSFGYEWPVDKPILSERDQSLPVIGEHQW